MQIPTGFGNPVIINHLQNGGKTKEDFYWLKLNL